jgi:PAS domain S-box-containing protein
MKKIFHWIDSRFGIQGKLTIIFIVLSTLPLVLIGMFAIQRQTDSMKTRSLQNIKIDIQELKDRTSAFFSKIESEMRLLSRTSEMTRFLESLENTGTADSNVQDEVEKEFLELLINKYYFSKLNVLNNKGNEVFAILFDRNTPHLLPSEYLSDNPFWYYLYAVENANSDEVLILPSEIRHPKKKEIIQTISLVMPMFNHQNELASILIAHIDFQEFIGLFNISRRIDGGKIVIVSSEGYYIYSSLENDWNKLLANRDKENLFNDYSQQIADRILAGGQGTITEDKDKIIEYASILPQNVKEASYYIIFTDVATSVIFSKVHQFQKLFVFLVLIVGIISVAVGYLTARHYLKPIKHLITGAKNIKEGNLDFKFSSQSRDEIQILVEGINLLVKKARKALKESEERFIQIFKQSEYVIIIFDPKDHKIIDFNPAALRLYGYTRNQLVNNNISLLFEPSSYRRFKKVVASASGSDKFHIEQIDSLKKDGTGFKVAVRGKVIKLADVSVVYCDFRDLTEENRMKKEAQLIQEKLIQTDKMASMGRLASGVAHEINNPNNSIMLNIAALSEVWENLIPIIDRYYKENQDFAIKGIEYSEIREKIPRLFFGLSDATRRIKNITSDLKDFARQEPDGFKKDVDINEVTKTSLSLINSLILKSTKHFSISYGNTIPPIKANFQKLEQVIINLVQNACEALPDASKKISLSTSYKKENRNIEVKVVDEGSGIPKDNFEFITDPFFTTKRNSGGTGLGLSIASSIIKDHGGTLNFVSKEGKGTVVTINLPVK